PRCEESGISGQPACNVCPGSNLGGAMSFGRVIGVTALFAAVATAAVGASPVPQRPTTTAAPAAQHAAMPATSGAAQLRQDMRKLWTDHVVWTRDYIVAAVGDQPDAQAAANRLMKNQEDIGNAIAGYYGSAAGQQLTMLLKEHINIA